MKTSEYNGKLNIIGSNLKIIREKQNLSQEQLCNKLSLLGVTLYKNDIYRIENNKRHVKDFELIAIMKVLNVNINDLIDFD